MKSRRWICVRFATSVVTMLLLTSGTAASAQEPTPEITLMPGSVTPAVITAGDVAVQTFRISRPAPPGGVPITPSGERLYERTLADGSPTGRMRRVPEGETSISIPVRFSTDYSEPTVLELRGQVPGSPSVKAAEVTILPADPVDRGVRALEGPRSVLDDDTFDVRAKLTHPAPATSFLVRMHTAGTGTGGINLMAPFATFAPGETTTSVQVSTTTNAPVPSTVYLDFGTTVATWDTIVVPRRFAISGSVIPPGGDGRSRSSLTTTGTRAPTSPVGTTTVSGTATPAVSLLSLTVAPAGSAGTPMPTSTAPYGTFATITARWNGQVASDVVDVR